MKASDDHRDVASREGRPRPVFAIAAVLLGSFLANFDSRLIAVGLPDLRGVFSLSFDEGAWVSTASIGSQRLIVTAVCRALMVLCVVHGLMVGTFVPATLLIIFRTLPTHWWLPAIALYSIRVGFAVDTSSSLVGFYVEHWGWQWLYWQGAVVAPLMALMVYLGAPRQAINRELLKDADWGGMLLLGAGLSMLYAGLDQGNRLDWLESGTVVSLLASGTILLFVFVANEFWVRLPWAHVEVLFRRKVS